MNARLLRHRFDRDFDETYLEAMLFSAQGAREPYPGSDEWTRTFEVPFGFSPETPRIFYCRAKWAVGEC